MDDMAAAVITAIRCSKTEAMHAMSYLERPHLAELKSNIHCTRLCRPKLDFALYIEFSWSDTFFSNEKRIEASLFSSTKKNSINLASIRSAFVGIISVGKPRLILFTTWNAENSFNALEHSPAQCTHVSWWRGSMLIQQRQCPI